MNKNDKPAEILLVDDEMEILRSLKRELRKENFNLTTANSAIEALEILKEKSFQVIISDNRMPKMTGIELFEQVKELYPETMKIVLTGYTDMESAIKAINNGEIHKFVTKPWKREQLLEHIYSALEKYYLIQENQLLTTQLQETNSQLAQKNENLKELATTDRMTGLLNHEEFVNDLTSLIKQFKRQEIPFAFGIFDIDNFKKVNDTYGHLFGDHVIKTIAQILKATTREGVDTTYRYGGEEFALLIRSPKEHEPGMAMERIRSQIEKTAMESDSVSMHVTISGGVGLYQTGMGQDQFVEAVDGALYHSKRNGKNQITDIQDL